MDTLRPLDIVIIFHTPELSNKLCNDISLSLSDVNNDANIHCHICCNNIFIFQKLELPGEIM